MIYLIFAGATALLLGLAAIIYSGGVGYYHRRCQIEAAGMFLICTGLLVLIAGSALIGI